MASMRPVFNSNRLLTTPTSCLRANTLRAITKAGSRRSYSVKQQTASGSRDRSSVGVFTPKAAALFVATGLGLFAYFRYEKERLLEQRQKELEDKQTGRPNVGGPFTLTTHEGTTFTEKDLLGKWSLIYFGFTNCPDICPEELDKMSDAVERLEKEYGPIVQPIFVSVDPARDPVQQIKRYVADFHPRLIGLTGDYQTGQVDVQGIPGLLLNSSKRKTNR
ncbi:hypothetical protein QCA50_001638 [Cerrena zonata]|uniref:Thioredoxin domain-containing protein n=1 Tax=Cerrena zonata TaxID=2478898 RepID=A0AAW0GWB3_9APHY